MRLHENTNKKDNVEKVERPNEKKQQINTQIKDSDTYNTGISKTETSGLLGF